jgi:hypothetical protein
VKPDEVKGPQKPPRKPRAETTPASSGATARPAGGESSSPPPGAAPPPPEPDRKPGARASALERKLEELFAAIALAFTLTGDQFSATVISRRSPDLARAWARLAQENPAVKRFLDGLLAGSSWGEAAMVTLGTVLPILWRKGIVPDELGQPFAMEVAADLVTPPSDEVRREQARRPPPAPGQPADAPAPGPAAMGEPGRVARPVSSPSAPPAPGVRKAPGPTPSGGGDARANGRGRAA